MNFAHEKERIEFEKNFHIEMGTGAAGADFVETFVVIESEDELAQNSQLGGFLYGGVEQIADGGGGHRPSGVDHEENSEKRGEGIEVPAPAFGTKEVGDEQGAAHEGIETGFGKPETRLRIHNGRGLLAMKKASAEPDGVAKDGVEGEEENTR